MKSYFKALGKYAYLTVVATGDILELIFWLPIAPIYYIKKENRT